MADTKVTDLTTASSVAATDHLYGVVGGNSRKVPVSLLATAADVSSVAARSVGFIAPPTLTSKLARVLKMELFRSVNGVPLVLPALLTIRECDRDLTSGGRFRFRLASFDGTSTYAELIRERGNGSYMPGAQSGQTWVTLEAANTSLGFAAGTALGRVLIDFGANDTFGTYFTTMAYSVGGIVPSVQQGGARFENDAAEVVNDTLARSANYKIPFSDKITSTAIRKLVRGIWLYGADPTHEYVVSVCTAVTFTTPLTRFDMTIRDITAGADVCTVRKQVSSQPGFGPFIATLPSKMKLTDSSITPKTKAYAVAEFDWTAVSDWFAIGGATVVAAGISPECVYSDEDIADYLDSDHWHEAIKVGTGQTYTTLRAAVESTYTTLTGSLEVNGAPLCDRACYHHRVLIDMVDDATYNATLLKIPDYVELRGNGVGRTFIMRENTNADEVLAAHLNTKMRDLTIISETPSEYCIHSDDFNRNVGGGVNQNVRIRQSFKRMRLVGGVGHNGWLFGCGNSSGEHFLFEDVAGEHLDSTATLPAFGFHNTGPTLGNPSLNVGVKPSVIEMRGCSSPDQLGVYLMTLEPAGISVLSLKDCEFNRIDHEVASGEVAGTGAARIQWDITGRYDGPFNSIDGGGDSYTLEWLPSATPKRRARNSTGASIPKGRFIKFTGANTVALCGVGEKPDGWTHKAIADGADGYVVLTKRIGTAYIEDAATSTGEWGLAANGLLDYGATVKRGSTIGGIVTVW